MGSSMDERKGEKVTSDLPWFGNSSYVHLFMRAWRHLYRLHAKERERERETMIIGPILLS